MTIYEPYEVERPFLNTLEWSVVRPFNMIHLCLILVTGLVIYLAYRRYRDRPVEDQDRFLFRLALFGVCLFAFRIFRRVLFYQFSIFTSLPLEICYISLILHPLIIRRPSLFGYHYSCFIALVTGLAFVFVVPDAYQVTIFSAAFIESRIEHIITLLIPVCLILWRRFTPQPRFILFQGSDIKYLGNNTFRGEISDCQVGQLNLDVFDDYAFRAFDQINDMLPDIAGFEMEQLSFGPDW